MPIIICDDGKDGFKAATDEVQLRAEYNALKEFDPDLPPFDEWVEEYLGAKNP